MDTTKIQAKLVALFEAQETIKHILEELQAEDDCFEDIDVDSLEILEGCTVSDNTLYQGNKKLAIGGLVDDLYFCNQKTGYCEDDYYGNLYFPLPDEGKYLKAYYEC